MEHAMTQSRLRSLFAAVGASTLALVSGAALAGEIQIKMDQVRIIAIKTPFNAIFVGNPVIADVTVIDENHVFLMGREFGTTNIVAIDDEGNQVAEEVVTVTTQQGKMVTLQRGTGASTLTCNAERCQIRPTPGDDPTRYQTEQQQITAREGQALGAATAAGGPPQQ
jgi:Flp pilus assembly secretin CpaC